jgi:serine/threonine protein kinase
MASIYLARRAGDQGRQVAVKVLDHSRASDAEACTMFLDEGRIVAMLDHQNIASVLDVDVSPDGQHYLAMEYVHGADLRELLTAASLAEQAIPYETAIAIVMGAAAGLDHAHRRSGPDGSPLRLVHRDVSLSNIMVGHDGSVKVVDFGIASTTLTTVHTAPGIVRGKASYMSPEQCLGDRVDHRTDVFALGIVLYELTTGARCFSGTTDFDRMLAVVRGDYIQPRDLITSFPPELEHVIRRALSTDPTRRYPSAAALIDALAGVLACRGWSGGTPSIARVMRELFGVAVPEPRPVAEAPATMANRELHRAPTLRLPRLARGTLVPELARGSAPDLASKLTGHAPARAVLDDDDDDQPTRGRRAVKRPPSSPVISG